MPSNTGWHYRGGVVGALGVANRKSEKSECMALQIITTLIGLALLFAGVTGFLHLYRLARTGRLPSGWRHWRVAVFVIGSILAVLGAVFGSYPFHHGRIYGIPFIAATFDASGQDTNGPLTMPAIIGNAAVSFLLPQFVLAHLAKKHLAKPPQE